MRRRGRSVVRAVAHVRHSCTRSQSGSWWFTCRVTTAAHRSPQRSLGAGRRTVRGHSLHPVNAALAAAATLVAVAFGLSTLDRWLRRRRPYELAWTIALALFALGAGAMWWAETVGWALGSFRVFFLAGAVLNVPWLALGTVYLLAGDGA